MVLIIYYKDHRVLYDEVREVEVTDNSIIYYKKNYYNGDKHEVDFSEIDKSYLSFHGTRNKLY